MDWASRFLMSIYYPHLSHVFEFGQFVFSENELQLWEQVRNVKITRDYIHFKAWVS